MTRTHPLSRTDIYQVVALAVRAPSIHNTQPWSIHADTDSLEVWADRNRQLPVTDPDGWALRVSCGALVFGLRLALVTYGWDSTVTLLPDSHEPDLLAHVKLTEQRVATPLEQRLGRAVPLRRSNRYPFADSPVPKPVLEAISAAAAAENCWIRTLQDRIQVVQVAELVREASQHLTARPGYQEELTSWIHDHGSDGVPRRAGGPAPEPQDLLPFRNFGGRSRAVGGEYEPWPLLAVLGTSQDRPFADLRAGQALYRVLLTLTHHGLAASMFSQPIEDGPSRTRLAELVGRPADYPQMVLRIGYGMPVPASPRRPVEEVITFTGALASPIG